MVAGSYVRRDRHVIQRESVPTAAAAPSRNLSADASRTENREFTRSRSSLTISARSHRRASRDATTGDQTFAALGARAGHAAGRLSVAALVNGGDSRSRRRRFEATHHRRQSPRARSLRTRGKRSPCPASALIVDFLRYVANPFSVEHVRRKQACW